jgi:hypothetical protein
LDTTIKEKASMEEQLVALQPRVDQWLVSDLKLLSPFPCKQDLLLHVSEVNLFAFAIQN